jgi:diacylglycerol kinase
MPPMTEFLEEMKHAAEGGEEHGHEERPSRFSLYVGLTMAFLGVLLAFSSAMWIAQNTELIAKMVAHTNVSTKYQALSTKYRVLRAQLRQLHSLQPDPVLFKKWDEESKSEAGAIASVELSKLAKIIRLENAKNLNAEIPTHTDLLEFIKLIRKVELEQNAALTWTEAFEPAIEAHEYASEHYDWALLASEIAIVIASIALLFSSRAAWFTSLLLIFATVLILCVTYITSSSNLEAAEEHISQARARFEGLDRKNDSDEILLKSVESDQLPAIEP